MVAILPGFIDAILKGEQLPLRFEAFVVDLLGESEGATLVPTSRVHDLGRDSRTLARLSGLPVVAASVSQSLDAKVVQDARRLSVTTKPSAVIYATTADLTERRIDELTAAIRHEIAAVDAVRVVGLTQIRALVQRFEEPMKRHYRVELEDLALSLRATEDEDRPEITGLRLALQVTTGEDALELRREIGRRLVLERLAGGDEQSLGAISVAVSARLHLAKSLSTDFLKPIVEDCVSAGHVHALDGHYRLSESGRATLSGSRESTVQGLVEGRTAVRETLATLLGYSIAERDFARFWPVFQDTLAQMFYQHGLSIVRMVTSIGTGESIADEGAFNVARIYLADRSAAVFANAEQREELRQAVIDMLGTKATPAFDWLTGVCAVFVMMCSLGLEGLSAAEVGRVLRGITLLPDTDLLISSLCAGEQNHEDVVRVLRGWRALGGAIRAPVPALEEVAYHAWIADHDYVQVADIAGTISNESATVLIANAFVRTFRTTAKNVRDVRIWRAFVDEFRGATEYDWSVVIELLRDEHGIEPFALGGNTAAIVADPRWAVVRRYLLNQAASELGCGVDELDEIVQDKANRDAQILVSLFRAREQLRQAPGFQTAVVVSSARPLRRASQQMRADLGNPDGVVTLAAIAALLALTPGVHMGVGTLRGVLFDLRLAKRLSGVELLAHRVIARSEQYELPLGRRATLKRRLRDAILRDATRRGQSEADARTEVLRMRDPERTASVVKEALDGMAVRGVDMEAFAALQRRVAQLEEELEAARGR